MACYSSTPCGNPACVSCYPCDPCTQPASCPVQLDTSCVIYHKQNNELSELTNLDLPNGSTLELILEQIDAALEGFTASAFALPILRTNYTVNTLKQFMVAVDTEIGELQLAVGNNTFVETSLTATDSASIDFTVSGTSNHTLTGSVKISTTLNNLLSVTGGGLYAAPQTLSVNYTTKELTISNGNTVSLSALSSGVGGYLGAFTADPVAVNGQYWYNTTDSLLKIRLQGVDRTIQLV